MATMYENLCGNCVNRVQLIFVLCRSKNFGRHCLSIKKKKSVLYCHHDYRLDYERYFLGGKIQNSKLFCHFYYTERLTQVIYVRLL
jgi:hypothetical protein